MAAWWGCAKLDARASSYPPPLLTATRYIWRHRSRSRHSADGCIRKCKELWQITITTRVQVRSHWLCSSIRAACGCFEIILQAFFLALSSFFLSRRPQFLDHSHETRISCLWGNWSVGDNFLFILVDYRIFFLEGEERKRTSDFFWIVQWKLDL